VLNHLEAYESGYCWQVWRCSYCDSHVCFSATELWILNDFCYSGDSTSNLVIMGWAIKTMDLVITGGESNDVNIDWSLVYSHVHIHPTEISLLRVVLCQLCVGFIYLQQRLVTARWTRNTESTTLIYLLLAPHVHQAARHIVFHDVLSAFLLATLYDLRLQVHCRWFRQSAVLHAHYLTGPTEPAVIRSTSVPDMLQSSNIVRAGYILWTKKTHQNVFVISSTKPRQFW